MQAPANGRKSRLAGFGALWACAMSNPSDSAALDTPITVAALYRFAPFADRDGIAATLKQVCADAGIKGTLLLADEGINGTIAGSSNGIAAVINHIRTLPGCTDLEVKYSTADTPPFQRMKVRLKKEIVTMGVTDIDPVGGVGTHLDSADWNALIADPDTVIIDTRNDYEVAIGSFERAIDPGTRSFREFPGWFDEFSQKLDGANPPKIAMFCTGGIRCEKATAYVKAKGFDDVYHLDGGILKYLEEIAPDQSRWNGECFVFDERVSVTHGVEQGTHISCKGCGRALSPTELQSPLYDPGVACPHCASPEQPKA